MISVEQARAISAFSDNSEETVVEAILPNLSKFKSSSMLAVPDDLWSQSQTIYQSYVDNLVKADLAQASSILSIVSSGAMKLLSLLGHECSQYSSNKSEFTLVDTVRSASMIGLVICEKTLADSDVNYRLYPLVNSDGNLKILPQGIYMYEFFRGQKLLNQNTSLDLENRFDAGFLAERSELVEKFNTKVRALLKKEDE